MTRYVALLRGINLGAKNRLGMQPLRDSLHAAGYTAVRTHLQSGNIVLTSRQLPDGLATGLRNHIAGEFDLDVPVLVRSRDELADILARDPFGELAHDPKRYQISMLDAPLDTATNERLTTADVAPDRVTVDGHEIYVWYEHGMHGSKLANMLTQQRLGVTVTARNWATMATLLNMADG